MAANLKFNIMKSPQDSTRVIPYFFNCAGSGGTPANVSGSNYTAAWTASGSYTVTLEEDLPNNGLLSISANMHLPNHTDATDPPQANVGDIDWDAGTFTVLTHVAGTLTDVEAVSGSVSGLIVYRNTCRSS